MRVSVLFVAKIALLFSVVSAQLNIPGCAANCLTTSSFGTCSHTDTTCLCASVNAPEFQADLTDCGVKNCDHDDALTAGLFCANVVKTMAPGGFTGSVNPPGAPPTAAASSPTGTAADSSPVLMPSTTATGAPVNAARGSGVGILVAVLAPVAGLAVLGAASF